MKIKQNIYQNKLIVFLFIIIVVLCSGHAFQTFIWQIEYLPVLGVGLLSIPILNQFLYKTLDVYTGSLLIFMLMILATFVANMDKNIRYYFLFSCIIMTAFGISLVYSFKEMRKVYLKIMDVVALVGVLGYFLINNTAVLNFLPRIVNVNGVEYSVGIIFNSINTIPERNCGMFWEPGLFATYLIIALVIEITYKEEKINYIRIVIYSVGIFTAHSSAGYALWFFCILLYLTRSKTVYKKNISKHIVIKVIQFILFLVLIIIVLNYDTIIYSTSLANSEYIQKLLPENISNSLRALAVQHNLNIFFENPIFGAGITDVLSQIKYVADTSTSTYLLSIYGVLGVVHTILWIYVIFKDKKTNLYSKILLLIIFMSILNKEPHTNLMFMWCFLFWLLKESRVNREYGRGI